MFLDRTTGFKKSKTLRYKKLPSGGFFLFFTVIRFSPCWRGFVTRDKTSSICKQNLKSQIATSSWGRRRKLSIALSPAQLHLKSASKMEQNAVFLLIMAIKFLSPDFRIKKFIFRFICIPAKITG
jgi:hypothetical protein